MKESEWYEDVGKMKVKKRNLRHESLFMSLFLHRTYL